MMNASTDPTERLNEDYVLIGPNDNPVRRLIIVTGSDKIVETCFFRPATQAWSQY